MDSRHPSIGGLTQSELAQISHLTIGRIRGTSTPPPTKKRPAASDIHSPTPALQNNSTFGAKLAPQSSSSCVKRLACGMKTPFPSDCQVQCFDQNVLGTKIQHDQCGRDAAYQQYASAPETRRPSIETLTLSTAKGHTHLRSASDMTDTLRIAANRYPGIRSQPDSRHISSSQLAGEVKNIYSDLVAVEAKCISLDNAELASDRPIIETHESDKWQALIALHRTLLYEHHDFLAASQHPAANEPLRKLALKYSMPARMWQHAIHSFLEVLRRRLPDSMDYMLQFLYTAYQMMSLLYETIDSFKPTWIECLGDLARYRMVIEDEVQRDRDTWGMVAQSWYAAASDISPNSGRLYHHLGILAQQNAVQQLHYYCRSLTCIEPFPNARESLNVLFESALDVDGSASPLASLYELDETFVRIHATMYMNFAEVGSRDNSQSDFLSLQKGYISALPEQMASIGAAWKDHGVFIAIANIAACFEYGYHGSDNPLAIAFDDDLNGKSVATPQADQAKALRRLMRPAALLFLVFAAVLSREGDYTVLPHVHSVLVLLKSIVLLPARTQSSLKAFLQLVPWWQLTEYLNSFMRTDPVSTKLLDGSSPKTFQTGCGSPLPEDYSLRGEVWTREYFPRDWFKDAPGEETRYLEQPSTDKTRLQRVYWLGISISKVRCLLCPPKIILLYG